MYKGLKEEENLNSFSQYNITKDLLELLSSTVCVRNVHTLFTTGSSYSLPSSIIIPKSSLLNYSSVFLGVVVWSVTALTTSCSHIPVLLTVLRSLFMVVMRQCSWPELSLPLSLPFMHQYYTSGCMCPLHGFMLLFQVVVFYVLLLNLC